MDILNAELPADPFPEGVARTRCDRPVRPHHPGLLLGPKNSSTGTFVQVGPRKRQLNPLGLSMEALVS